MAALPLRKGQSSQLNADFSDLAAQEKGSELTASVISREILPLLLAGEISPGTASPGARGKLGADRNQRNA
jgi:hypothetical protein